MKQKIFSLQNLERVLNKKRSKGKKIVLCHGVFDLLHIGHIKHFNKAKSFGDILVVTLTPDKYVNKGPSRPAFVEKSRLEAVAALEIVDYVALNSSPTAVNVIKKIKPNIYCKGSDYKNHKNDLSGQIKKEIYMVKKTGGKIVYTDGITFSSSKIININETNSDLHKLSIKKIKKYYTFSKIRELIESFKKIKVLIIGETIIDQYVFCEALGKSGKEPMLVLRDIKTEDYLGGAAALSRHLSPFCDHISLLSMVGEKREYLNEIEKKLPKNVNFKYIRKKNSPTILKRRFLDNVSNNKVLGVYTINDDILTSKEERLFNRKLIKLVSKYDLVIVSDYGHGFISKKSANLICKLSKYSAINAQVNAANVGYHSMRNYKNVDCIIINDKEIRHELRDKNGEIKLLMKRLSQEQNVKNLIVTRGELGSIFYRKKDKKFNYCDAFTRTAVDKIGAGDAMLSVIALCLKSGFTKDLALLIASLAGAQSVKTIGNKASISKTQILKSLEHILK
jgi:rfaE bifunctional protein kinase chain/domain/rfaE bifunctional protein nucleotidyltransferase chain/domain